MEGSEFAITSALLAALGAVVYFSWSGSPAAAQQTNLKATSTTKTKVNTKRGKKRRPNETSTLIPAPTDHDDSAMETSPSDTKPAPKSKSTSPQPPAAAPRVVVQRSEATIPGGLAPLLSASEMEGSVHSAGSAARSTQKKKRKAAKKDQAPAVVVQESEGERVHPGGLMLAPPQPTPHVPVPPFTSKQQRGPTHETSGASEFDSESGWTRVKRSNKDRSAGGTMESTSDAGVTTSVTEEEGSVASASVSAKRDRGKTLTSAEKLLPKAAETKVDDMLDGPKPGIARVLRVPGSSTATPAYEQPAQGLTWDDYEDGDDVKGSGADADEEDSTWDVVSHKRRGGAQTPSTYVSDSVSTRASTSGAPSKKQRQNAAKREAEKAAKAQAEKERVAKLQQHARDLEKLKIAEQFKGKSGKGAVSGGMQAQVDSAGNLIWE